MGVNDDKLDRLRYISAIKHILDNSDTKYRRDCLEIDKASDDKPADRNFFALALNGQFGSGKTTLLRMLDDYVYKTAEYKKEYSFVYYNAWEKDYFDDPLYSLLVQIYEGLSDKIEYKAFRASFAKITKDILPNLGSVTVGPVRLEASKIFMGVVGVVKNHVTIWKKKSKPPLPDIIENKQKAMNELKKELKKILKTYKLVLVIDELDRCRPAYALQVLEIVKHIINIEGIKYIFALDIDVLERSIHSNYKNLEASNYLLRFFDVIIDLKNDASQSIRYINELVTCSHRLRT